MRSMIATYNAEVARLPLKPEALATAEFVTSDPRRIKWSSSLVSRLERGQLGVFSTENMVVSTYRPFQKAWIYYDKMFIHRPGQMSSIFPEPNVPNLIISVPSPGNVTPFSALMTDSMQDLSVTAAKAGTQCFPLHFFDSGEGDEGGFFADQSGKTTQRYAITDTGLKHFLDAYPGEAITKEDLFYYVYGLLHSEDYRAKYADNLSKELPRIPRVKTAADFWAFSRAGRTLGDLHVNYETVEPYPVTIKQGDLRLADIKNPEAFYRVTKWAFGKNGKEKDKTTVIYNANITMQDVPLPILLLALTLASPALGQNFSCRIGTQPACLDYGDKVCSSSGMCVDQNAACFDKYQCNYEGFTCKSNVTECAETHDALLRKHNELVDDFNENLELARGMATRLDEIETCLLYAGNLDDAKSCGR